MASTTVDPIDWSNPQPSSAVPPGRLVLSKNLCNLSPQRGWGHWPHLFWPHELPASILSIVCSARPLLAMLRIGTARVRQHSTVLRTAAHVTDYTALVMSHWPPWEYWSWRTSHYTTRTIGEVAMGVTCHVACWVRLSLKRLWRLAATASRAWSRADTIKSPTYYS